MYYVFELLKDYNIEYNRKAKILTIKEPISVKLFVYIKHLLQPYRDMIEDIRIETLGSLRDNYERRF